MICLVYGDQDLMVEKRIKKLVEARLNDDINDLNYRYFDARESLISDVMEECEFLPFGSDAKVVVLDYAYFLQKEPGAKIRLDKKQDFTSLEKYLSHPFEYIDLIIAVRSSNLNETSKLYKAIANVASINALKSLTSSDWPIYASKYFLSLKVKITPEAIDELGERVQYNLTAFVSEAQKLASYTNSITIEDIHKLTPKPLESNIFLMINALTRGDKETCLSIFNDIQKSGINNEPVVLLIQISSQLRILCQVLYLRGEGLANNQIASRLSLNEYRVKKMLENAGRTDINKVYAALDELYKLDDKIKNRKIVPLHGLELFLANTSLK